jgi:hypothetical protein
MDILGHYEKENAGRSTTQKETRSFSMQQDTNLDNETHRSRVILGNFQKPKLIHWVLRYSSGLIKTERQAAYVLLVIACIIGIVSCIIFLREGFGTYVKRGGPGLTPQELEQYRKIQPF